MRKYLHALVLVQRFLRGQLAVPEIGLVSRFIEANAVCFDVGAHGGAWSRSLSRLAPRGHVYGFEASPYYMSVLKLLKPLMFLSNVDFIGKAVSDREGVLDLVWKDICTGRTTTST